MAVPPVAAGNYVVPLGQTMAAPVKTGKEMDLMFDMLSEKVLPNVHYIKAQHMKLVTWREFVWDMFCLVEALFVTIAQFLDIPFGGALSMGIRTAGTVTNPVRSMAQFFFTFCLAKKPWFQIVLGNAEGKTICKLRGAVIKSLCSKTCEIFLADGEGIAATQPVFKASLGSKVKLTTNSDDELGKVAKAGCFSNCFNCRPWIMKGSTVFDAGQSVTICKPAIFKYNLKFEASVKFDFEASGTAKYTNAIGWLREPLAFPKQLMKDCIGDILEDLNLEEGMLNETSELLNAVATVSAENGGKLPEGAEPPPVPPKLKLAGATSAMMPPHFNTQQKWQVIELLTQITLGHSPI